MLTEETFQHFSGFIVKVIGEVCCHDANDHISRGYDPTDHSYVIAEPPEDQKMNGFKYILYPREYFKAWVRIRGGEIIETQPEPDDEIVADQLASMGYQPRFKLITHKNEETHGGV
jgi:hypothetical protein